MNATPAQYGFRRVIYRLIELPTAAATLALAAMPIYVFYQERAGDHFSSPPWMIAVYVAVYAVLVGVVLAVAIAWIGVMRKPLDERRVRQVLTIILVMGWFTAMGYVLALTEKLPAIPLPGTGLHYTWTWASLLGFPVAVLSVLTFIRVIPPAVRWLELPQTRTIGDRLKTASKCFGVTAVVLALSLLPAPSSTILNPSDQIGRWDPLIYWAILFGPPFTAYLYYKLGMGCVRRILGDPDPAAGESST